MFHFLFALVGVLFQFLNVTSDSEQLNHEMRAMPTEKTITPCAARKLLKQRGHSYRTAAPYFGVTYQHLHSVLNGARSSRRLLEKVATLPAREEVAK